MLNGLDLSANIASYMVVTKDVSAWSLASAALTAVLAFVVPFKKMPPVEDIPARKKSLGEKVVAG